MDTQPLSGYERAVRGIAFWLREAEQEWVQVHGDGWNEAYLRLVPTLHHQMARKICDKLGLEALPH